MCSSVCRGLGLEEELEEERREEQAIEAVLAASDEGRSAFRHIVRSYRTCS